jgi:hypothetical protein
MPDQLRVDLLAKRITDVRSIPRGICAIASATTSPNHYFSAKPAG